MSRAALAVAMASIAYLGGCAKKRIPECDALVKMAETLATCPKVPDDQRKPILDSAKTIRDSLLRIDDAPSHLVSSMRDACRTQSASLEQLYGECLK